MSAEEAAAVATDAVAEDAVPAAAIPAAAEQAAPAAADPTPAPATTSSPNAPTIVVLGGTGQTGKWFLKGAVLRGYNLRIIARSAKKTKVVLAEVLGNITAEVVETKYFKTGQCTVIETDGFAVSKLVEAGRGADTIASFVGLIQRGVNVVLPACEAVLEACEKLYMEEQESGATDLCPKQFLLMSTIGVNDGVQIGRKAWGRFVMCCTGCLPTMKSGFGDLKQGEMRLMDYQSSRGKNFKTQLNIVRCSILKDTKDYVNAGLDTIGGASAYELVDFGDADALKMAKTSFDIDRWIVAQAFLDLVNAFDKRLERSAVEVKKYACFAKKV